MTPLMRDQACRLWRQGLDTYSIARLLSIPEHEVYNALAKRFATRIVLEAAE